MEALDYDDVRYLKDELQYAVGVKEKFLTWSEYLDFFFLQNELGQDRMEKTEIWWHKIDDTGKYPKKKKLQEGEEANMDLLTEEEKK